MQFFKCKGCGNFVTFLNDKSGCTPKCCGEVMEELVPNTSDGASEKHVPVISKFGNEVTVTAGSISHPMIDNHYIEWIILETTEGFTKKDLKPGDTPSVTFTLNENEEVIAAYAYCNLHGLWKNN